MMDLVLRNAAVRAAHEIAWMTDEIGELEAFAGRRDAGRAPTAASTSTTSSSATGRRARRSRARWRRPSAAGDDERTQRGAALMAHRVEREQEVMCGWSPVGR